jgi:arsenate reductase
MRILSENGEDPMVVDYLHTPLNLEELTDVLTKLGGEAQQMIRFKEAVALDLGLTSDDSRSTTEWLELIVANPSLLQRPIVVDADRAVIGRPPEAVLDLVD